RLRGAACGPGDHHGGYGYGGAAVLGRAAVGLVRAATCSATKALRAESRNRSAQTTVGASRPTPSATWMPLAVPPPRISWARERRKPSTPPRAASWAGSAPVAGREIVTTRDPGASDRIALL